MNIKLTHKQVDYKATASIKTRCATCDMYRETQPAMCTLVQPPIRPNDVCDRWESRKRPEGG